MGEGVSRTEFLSLQKKVDGLDEKMTDLSEGTIKGITELSGDVKAIMLLLKQSVADTKTSNTNCRADCNKKIEAVNQRQGRLDGRHADLDRRVREQEINWAKLTGIAAAVGAASGIITGLVLKFIG